MRNRARRALLAGLILFPALAISSPARADSVSDWNATAAAALQTPGNVAPQGTGQGAVSGGSPGNGPHRRLRRGQRDRGRPRSLPLLGLGRALVFAGRRGRRCSAVHPAQRRDGGSPQAASRSSRLRT